MQSHIKEKARRGPGGGLVGLAANRTSNTLSIHPNGPKNNTRDLSIQLDFALERTEFHQDQEAFHLAQAHHHHDLAERHRSILKSLQALIPPPAKINTEGDSTDG